MLYDLFSDSPTALFRLMSNGAWIHPQLSEITIENNEIYIRFMGPYWIRFKPRTGGPTPTALTWTETLPSQLAYMPLKQIEFNGNNIRLLTCRWSLLEITGPGNDTVVWNVEESHDTFWRSLENRVRGFEHIGSLTPGQLI